MACALNEIQKKIDFMLFSTAATPVNNWFIPSTYELKDE
jgi:hypothetical protein